MRVTITTRHCEIPDILKVRAEALGERLDHLTARAVECTILFENDHQAPSCEVRLHVARGRTLVARGEAGDHRTALDRAEEKLRNQLDKAPARPRRSRADRA